MTAYAEDPALAELPAATDRFLATLRAWQDADVAAPSRCEGWTRGHVAAHIARNADGFVNLVAWARSGVETPMYASREQRNADIEAGSSHGPLALETDVEESAERLLAALAEVPEDRMGTTLRLGSGRVVTAAELPWLRLREVEIHHVDLDAGYEFARTPAWVLARILDETAAMTAARAAQGGPGLEAELVADDAEGAATGRWTLGEAPGVTVHGRLADLVAWVTGRGDGAALRTVGGPLPRVPAWG